MKAIINLNWLLNLIQIKEEICEDIHEKIREDIENFENIDIELPKDAKIEIEYVLKVKGIKLIEDINSNKIEDQD